METPIEKQCHVCGRPTRVEKSEFDLHAFIYRGGPHIGEIGFSIIPDGVEQIKCYTNEGCGEMTYDIAAMKQMEEANKMMQTQTTMLKSLLSEVRDRVRS